MIGALTYKMHVTYIEHIFYRTQRAQVEQRNNNRILKAKYDYLSIWVSISDDYRAVSELVLL